MDILYRLKLKDLLQERLTIANSLIPLSILGILVGIASGLSMTALHALINLPISSIVTDKLEEIGLPITYGKAILPLLATLLLLTLFASLPKKLHKVGILHVLESLNYNNGNISIRNALVQFIAAAISLGGGLSVGKEGPAVHIGAAFGSKIGLISKLSTQNREVLIACGAAGAIAAAFHTPLAGVLFALEVIILGFHASIILPIILSSVVAMSISHYLLGSIQLFNSNESAILEINLSNFISLGILAVFISLLANTFFRVQQQLWKLNTTPLVLRFLSVGAVTAICAISIPEVLGIGYEPLKSLTTGETLTNSILIILTAKLLLTAFSIAFGIPGGMIGPLFVIGGFAGAQIAIWFFVSPSLELLSLFILLGMATMMASTLQAPLAGLAAIIELSNSSGIILPAMLVIGVSCVITRAIFKQDSIFIEHLRAQDKVPNTANRKILRKINQKK